MPDIPKPDARRLIRAKMQYYESIIALEATRLTQTQRRVLYHVADSVRTIIEEHERQLAQDTPQTTLVRTSVTSDSGLAIIEAKEREITRLRNTLLSIMTTAARARMGTEQQFDESKLPESPELTSAEAQTDEPV